MRYRGREADATADFAAFITGVDPRDYTDEDDEGEFFDLTNTSYVLARLAELERREAERQEE